MNAALVTVGAWFLPIRQLLPPVPRALVGVALALALVGIVVFVLRLHRTDPAHGAKAIYLDMMPLIVFVLVFTIQLVATATVVAYRSIGDRLLAPVFVPLVLLLLYSVDSLQPVRGRRFSARAVDAAVVCGLGLFLVYPLAYAAKATRSCLRDGAGGYSTTLWQNSDLIAHIKRDPPPGRIVSNAPDAVYMLAGMFAEFSPRKHLFNAPASTAYDDMPAFVRSLSSGDDTFLVWFKDVARAYLYDLEELRSLLVLEPVAETSHGAVYLVRPPPDSG